MLVPEPLQPAVSHPSGASQQLQLCRSHGQAPWFGCRPQVAFLGGDSTAFTCAHSRGLVWMAEHAVFYYAASKTRVFHGIYPCIFFISECVHCWHAAEFFRCWIVLFASLLCNCSAKRLCAQQVVCDLKPTKKAPCPRDMPFFFFNRLWFSSLTTGASALPKTPCMLQRRGSLLLPPGDHLHTGVGDASWSFAHTKATASPDCEAVG